MAIEEAHDFMRSQLGVLIVPDRSRPYPGIIRPIHGPHPTAACGLRAVITDSDHVQIRSCEFVEPGVLHRSGLSAIYKNARWCGRFCIWRRDRDSNPGEEFTSTRFPGVRLKPLGHLSVFFSPRHGSWGGHDFGRRILAPPGDVLLSCLRTLRLLARRRVRVPTRPAGAVRPAAVVCPGRRRVSCPHH